MDELFDETDGSKQLLKTKPFIKFCQLNRPKFRQKFPKCTAAQISNLLAQEWGQMSHEKQNFYIASALSNETDFSSQRNSKFKVAKIMTSPNPSGYQPSHQISGMNLVATVPVLPNSPNLIQSKGKGKKKNNLPYPQNGINKPLINNSQHGKIDRGNEMYIQNTSRGAIPAPILDDSSNFMNDIDQNQEESARKLMNFTDYCVIINSPASTFDISWGSNNPSLK